MVIQMIDETLTFTRPQQTPETLVSGGAGALPLLRAAITARYGTLYAFIKDRPGGLAKGTFYQVLKGRYGGNVERQITRIQAALAPAGGGSAEADQAAAAGPRIFETLKEVACGRCRKKRPRARQCEKCFDLWRAQAAALERRRR